MKSHLDVWVNPNLQPYSTKKATPLTTDPSDMITLRYFIGTKIQLIANALKVVGPGSLEIPKSGGDI